MPLSTTAYAAIGGGLGFLFLAAIAACFVVKKCNERRNQAAAAGAGTERQQSQRQSLRSVRSVHSVRYTAGSSEDGCAALPAAEILSNDVP